MFFTTEVFLNKKTPISRLWFAGHSNQYNTKRLPRRILAECDIVAMTKCVMEPEEKLALRFSSVLMHGCARIHSQKQRYMWDDMIAAKEKLMQNYQNRSLDNINKKAKFEATTLSDVHASEMMFSFNENDFLNAELAAEVYVLPKFTPTQTTVNSSLREGNSALSHSRSHEESSPNLDINSVLEADALGEFPSCGIIDFENAVDQDPGFFDDAANVENGNDFQCGFEENSTMHAASVADKETGNKRAKQSKHVSKRPKFDSKTEYTTDQMRVMLHDVSDIVSTEPDRFGRRAKAGYTIDSMFKCSVAHMMGMQGYLLEHFERGFECNQANRLELSDIIDPAGFNDQTDFGADYGAGFDDHFPGDISTIDGASEIATSRGKNSRNESRRPTSRRPSTGSVIEEPEMLRAVFDSFSQDDLLPVGTSRRRSSRRSSLSSPRLSILEGSIFSENLPLEMETLLEDEVLETSAMSSLPKSWQNMPSSITGAEMLVESTQTQHQKAVQASINASFDMDIYTRRMHRYLIDQLAEESADEKETIHFTQIVPTTSSKTLAARCFFQMLVLKSSNVITLQNCIPRGADLVIGRGPMF